ncbi:hypothetical protein Q31b_30890 [Novipirellula aureliae]|uniref:Uncharacterized protein n=1 Tax=Novipirellula aureliae TaxID=2527966 RepID=A0A5C6DYW9_9BACT|nr:hypothetical protein [Novipirellula aureliae]TWU41635.1 hypothetical protein Q31b_30890 [Novipirellula aureliae]
MRLTLRTLLAYLDNTLDPADAESLRNKVAESSFAAQLVNRIRHNLGSSDLAAPSPDAVSPLEEANVISEFLDSTLPAEQVSEIERACLESDMQLAEAAACHQILTMVLGKSAAVSPELRKRIYELPDRDIADVATAGSFASISVPATELGDTNLNDVSGVDDLGIGSQPTSAAEPIDPVGPDDSGVSDAPTRIRQLDEAAEARVRLARGARPQSAIEAAQLYGGSIRTSRIAPWLVGLALAAALLFALVQVFGTFLDRDKIAATDTAGENTEIASQPIKPAPTSPSVQERTVGEPNSQTSPEKSESNTVSPQILDGTKPDPATQPEPVLGDPNQSPSMEVTTETAVDSQGMSERDLKPIEQDPIVVENGRPSDSGVEEEATGSDTQPMTESPAESAESAESGESESEGEGEGESEGESDGISPEVDITEPVETESTDREAGISDADAVAKITGDPGLLFLIDEDGTAVRVDRDTSILINQTVVCAPTFRVRLDTIDNIAVTLIGPARVRWEAVAGGDPVIHVEQGRMLLEATKKGADAELVLPDSKLKLDFPTIETLAAFSVTHFRQPGFDPQNTDNHIFSIGVLVPHGTLTLTADDLTSTSQPSSDILTVDGNLAKPEAVTLKVGERWIKRGDSEGELSQVDSAPDWTQPVSANDHSLEASAREALVSLMIEDQAVDLSLREATMFRRAEVGALAARTLLSIRKPDVYFGSDGILNNAEQRQYWIDHYTALVGAIDRDVETAKVVNDSMQRMDSANAPVLFKLLVGYSQKQLAEGGDVELIGYLDSPSMAVRALALENLKRISSGATLGYRPEQDSALRRSQAIKKWEARQRKGDIRWQTP